MALVLLLASTLLLAAFYVMPSKTDSYSRGAVSGLFVVLVFATQADGLQWRYPYICAVALIALGVLRGRKARGHTTWHPRTVLLWTIALWGYTAANTYFAGGQHKARLVILTVLLGAVAHWLREFPADQVRKMYVGVLGLSLFEAGAGFWQLTGHSFPWIPVYEDGATLNPLPGMSHQLRVFGTLQHSIPYSVVLNIGLVVALANPMRWRGRWCAVSAVILAAGIYASGSRSAFVATAIGVVAYYLQGVDIVRWLRNALLLSAASLGIAYTFGARIAQVNEALHNSGSYTQRASSASAFPDLLGRQGAGRWFGSGYRNVEQLYDKG